MQRSLIALFVLIGALVLYLSLWPVPVDPVAWQAPANPGYTGAFAPNDRLANIELLSIGADHGPEDVALDREGRIYAGTAEGHIVRLRPDGSHPEIFARTEGRPLGLDFDRAGRLLVADGYRGLLRVARNGTIELLTNECDGVPIRFADDLDVARDGKIYFSDASTKFGAREFGGPAAASVLEVLEQGRTGRLLVYDPADASTRMLVGDLSFANGVALSKDEDSVLVCETGRYRILRHWLKGARKGRTDLFVEELPGFPDNIERGADGLFWLALVSPRAAALDDLAESPFLRRVVFRLPEIVRPKTKSYLHILGLDATGRIVHNYQHPATAYAANTSVLATPETLYLGSLHEPKLARIARSRLD